MVVQAPDKQRQPDGIRAAKAERRVSISSTDLTYKSIEIMQYYLKGSCSVLAGSIVGALLGIGTFLTVEAASKYFTQNIKINHALSILECITAPLPLSKDRQALRRQLCENR